MSKNRFFIFFLLCFLPLNAAANLPVAISSSQAQGGPRPPITVEHPPQNTVLEEGAQGVFINGRISPASGILTVNGKRADIYRNGAFLIYIPLSVGKQEIILQLRDGPQTYKVKRDIEVKGFKYKDYEGKYKFDKHYHFPDAPLTVTTDEKITFTAAGTPGAKVFLSFARFKDVPMREQKGQRGVYKATISLKKSDALKKPEAVKFTMYDADNKLRAKFPARGKAEVLPPNDFLLNAEVLDEGARLRALPRLRGGPYITDTILSGVVKVTGQNDNFYRVSLGDDNIVWAAAASLKPLGAHEPQKNIVSFASASTAKDGCKTTLTIKNEKKVPFKIEEDGQTFSLTLFYTHAVKQIKNLKNERPSPSQRKLTYTLKKGQIISGFNYRYEGKTLLVDIFHKPAFKFTLNKPLNGLKVVLDPGHSPKNGIGAVGPTGLTEFAVNYKIAKAAEKFLKQNGASVYFSKTQKEVMNLAQRTEKIDKYGAHLFISLHNNALPYHANPFAGPRGFSMHYQYRHSRAFAAAMLTSYLKNIGLPSEGIIQSDFAVLRQSPQIPAILIENAHMIVPYQEDLLSQQSFINMLGKAINDGVIAYANPNYVPKPTTKPRAIKMM